MNLRTDWDDLLWEMGRNVSGEAAEEPSKEALAAYREGRLPAEEAEDLERALSHAPVGRTWMAELSGVGAGAPDARVREAFLARFDHSVRVSNLRRLVVQAALVAMGLSVLWLTRSPEPLPADLAYDVQAEGLATVRRTPPVRPQPDRREVDAYPETRIRISVSPRPEAVREVEFGLYRRSGRLLERLPFDSDVRLEILRGAALVSARAADLADPETHTAELLFAAARPGDLPRRFVVDSSDAASALAAGGRRRAYSLKIRFQAPTPANGLLNDRPASGEG